MSVIRLPLLYVGSKGEKYLYTLLGSGADLSCIHPDHNDIANTESLGRTGRVCTASEAHYIEMKHMVRLDFYLNDV